MLWVLEGFDRRGSDGWFLGQFRVRVLAYTTWARRQPKSYRNMKKLQRFKNLMAGHAAISHALATV